MVFILSALWLLRLRGLWKLPSGSDCLWVKLGLALVGKAILSTSLIQFSANGWGCSSVWGQTMVRVMEVMVTSFIRTYASIPGLPELLQSLFQPCGRPLLTHACSFLLDPVPHKVLLVPSKSLFPWGFSVLLPDPQVEKSFVGPRTFAIVWELFWYNWSSVYGWSARQLYTGSNGDILQMNVCHRPCLSGLLQPEPMSPWQVTADPCLCRRHSNTQSRVWFSLLQKSLTHSLGPGVHKVLFVPSEHLWLVWDLTLNVTVPLLSSCWGFIFALGCGASFFVKIQHSPVNSCSETSWDSGVLGGKDECTSFYSAILNLWCDKVIINDNRKKPLPFFGDVLIERIGNK